MAETGQEHCVIIGFGRIDFYVILPLKFRCVRVHCNMLLLIKDAFCQILIAIAIQIHLVYKTKVQFIAYEPANRTYLDPSNSAVTIDTVFFKCHTIKNGARGRDAITISALCHGTKQTKCQLYQHGMILVFCYCFFFGFNINFLN